MRRAAEKHPEWAKRSQSSPIQVACARSSRSICRGPGFMKCGATSGSLRCATVSRTSFARKRWALRKTLRHDWRRVPTLLLQTLEPAWLPRVGPTGSRSLCVSRPGTLLKIATICAGLVTGASAVDAKGCLKGAIIGGLAGHYAVHHGILGAAAGCYIGRHEAKRHSAPPARASAPPQTARSSH
jgi:hypothetical protein